jgi:predicted AlkP superfamily pyrophosphatase or phosphodiesterase
MHRSPFALFLVAACLALVSCTTPPAASAGPVILVSIDGFRWDYRQKYSAPTLDQLARSGAHATRMTPSYPSKTFPNHYTLVTGLRPGRHGIVNNWFHDPALRDNFTMERTEPAWWDGGEPIWVTAEKQGVRSACYFWPGSESAIHGVRPQLLKPFLKKLTPQERVAGVLEWFALPAEQRPRLATLYFDTVDTAGHDFGPDSPEVAAAIKEVDSAIAALLAGLERLGLRESANLVFVADHGMSEISTEQVVFLDDLLDLSLVSVESTGPVGGVRPKPGVDAAALVASIRAKSPSHLQVYLREDVPARLHYNRGDRIPPIVFLLEDHWTLEQKTGWPKLKARYHRATHGWDPATPNMGALLIAHGPAFRPGAQVNDVDNIHVYDLLCALLGIRPAPNDGDDRLARAFLARPPR